MTNPAVYDIPENTWVKIATNVTNGIVHTLVTNVIYGQTYRMTGEAAPDDFSDRKTFSNEGAEIDSSLGIDVYITAIGGDGRVRVDL